MNFSIYFQLPDSDSEDYYDRLNTNKDEDKVIIFKNASFSWAKSLPKKVSDSKTKKNKGKSKKRLSRVSIQRRDSSSSSETAHLEKPFMLNDISLEIGREDLIGVTGKVGSGKTSLLLAIIGEMLKKDGDIQIPDNFNGKYMSQVLQSVL